MKNKPCCIACGSDDLYVDGSMIEGQLYIHKKSFLPIKGIRIKQVICINCGYIHSYASDLDRLKSWKEGK
jgi:predicted nucleic-acid-binding Zn-ribbon protein